MKFIYTIILFLFTIGTGYAQKVFYQEICNCGVAGAGYSLGINRSIAGNGSIQVYIEPGSTIKKAFLFGHRVGYAPDLNFTFNLSQYQFDESNKVTNDYFYHVGAGAKDSSAMHVIEVTNDVDPTQTIYPINYPAQPITLGGKVFGPFYLLIIYENSGLPYTVTAVVLNEKSEAHVVNYNLINLFPFDNTNPIGIAVLSDILWDNINDGTSVIINGNPIGLIGGSDASTPNIGAGVKGHFYYQNNTLFGLDDDTPDSIMTGSDGLADIKTNIQHNDLSLNIELATVLAPPQENRHLAFFLAYTSPCDTFSVTHTPDTTICYGVPLQLQVQGGQAWEWTPQVGLSCYDCPNPVFTADSTMHYSIRIWNNDSCSKVLPLHIVVEEALPHFNFDMSPSECGDSTGSITVTPALSGFSYINQTTQDTNTTGIFSGLESGFYPISIGNNSACSFDTVVFIPETLSVNADFIASSNAGISPLPVAFTNTSSHANSYQWIYENQSSTQENINHIFHQDGIYPVMLIAYGNSILCADTAYDTIYVYLPIEVEIPNIFTPNSDQNNDQWGIKINVPAEADVQIFNRWGEIVLRKKEDITAPGFVPLWDGGEHVGGVYYYVVELSTPFEKRRISAHVTLVR